MHRPPTALLSLTLACLAAPGYAQPPGPTAAAVTDAVTVEALVARLASAPEVVAAAARVDAARAELRARRPLLPNPELEAELGLAPASGGDHTVATLALRQPLPLFATPGAGRAAARAAIAEAEAAHDEVLRGQARAAVERLAAAGLAAAEAELEDQALGVADALAAAAARRAVAGDIPDDEARLAAIEATLARARRDLAHAEAASAGVAACRAIGADVACRASRLVAPDEAPPELAALEAELAVRSDTRAADARVAAARAELAFARGAARIVPVVGLGLEREVDDHAGVVWRVVGSIGLPLPLWDPGQGPVDRHAAALREAEAARAAAQLDARAGLAAAHAEWDAAREAEAALAATPDEIDGLLGRAREGYERGAYELERVLVLNDRLLTARRSLVAARWRSLVARALLQLERPTR